MTATARPRPTVGQRLRKTRRDRVWTQHDLARESGVRKVTISRIENDRAHPRPGTARKLAGALGVELRWLVRGAGRKAASAPPAP